MDGIRGRRFAAQVGRFRARFAQAGSSTLSKLMPASLLEGLITQSRERWRDRIYGPLQTLKLFLDQVLSADGSCQDAVARGLSERTALGLALDPLAEDLADDGLGASERDIVKDAQREKLADKRPDPLLRESAAILGDAIEILGQDRKLSAQVLPDSPGPGRWAE